MTLYFKRACEGLEMAHKLSGPAAMLENIDFIPSAQMGFDKHVYLQSQELWSLLTAIRPKRMCR